MPDQSLHILILEDNPYDLAIVERELKQGGLEFSLRKTNSKSTFEAALTEAAPDIILADYKLPGFNGEAALKMAREKYPDTPFMIVSGEIGEERAVDIVKNGATDYVLKDKLARLVPSVKRALQEAENLRERRNAEAQLRESYRELERRVEERTRELSEANAALRELPTRIMEAQENERKKIAYELHDAVNQVLASVKFRVQLLEKSILNQTYKKGDLDELLGLIGVVIKELRRISHDLRPTALDDLGLVSALSNHCKEFEEQTGIKMDCSFPKGYERLPREVEVALYRTGQEALNNVMKHADAKEVELRIARDAESVEMTIEDNGHGFDLAAYRAQAGEKGMGLAAMEERVTSVGGTFKMTSDQGKGTKILIVVPVRS